MKRDWETDGTYLGHKVYCPTNAYGDCPYCDRNCICHITNPAQECEDFFYGYGCNTMNQWYDELAMEF